MKIKIINKSYDEVKSMPSPKHKKPIKQSLVLPTIVKLITIFDFIKAKFKCEKINMDQLNKKEPYLILMNHSAFFDLKIAYKLFAPRKFNIVTTDDAFVGQETLLRYLGCFPTKKFVNDPVLVKDILYVLRKLKKPVLMFPEAGYTIDGTLTTMPNTLGKFVKMMKVPVVIVTTYGSFSRDPLYNNLQVRNVPVSVKMEYAITPEDLKNKTSEELNEIIFSKLKVDGFKWQQENKIKIKEKFRCDYLERVLYKCPTCGKEGFMLGKGITIKCNNCGKEHELDEYGYLKALDNKETFTHIPDWYSYQRNEVKKEIENKTYLLDTEVDIYMLKNFKAIFKVGEGRLIHNNEGFKLNGCNGQLEYTQKADASYSINVDFNWYEIGDIICIGEDERFYCIPKDKTIPVAKVRLAVEELYKLSQK